MFSCLKKKKKKIYHLDIEYDDNNLFNNQILEEINKLRGKPLKLIRHRLVTFLANSHNEFNHNNFAIRSQLIKDNTKFKNVTENVAYGYTDPVILVHAWNSSPSHREALLGNYTHIVIGKNDKIITALFLR